MRLYIFFGQLYVTQLQSEFFNVISVARCLDWQSILSILRFLCILRTTQPNQLMNNYHLCLFIFFLGNACTLAKAALLNEIRTLKQAGRHPNIVNLIGTWVQGGEVYFNYPNNILTNLRKKGYPGYICKTVAANPQYSLTCMLVVGLRLLSHVVEFPSICSSKFAPDSQLFFPQRQFLSSPNWSMVVALKAF